MEREFKVRFHLGKGENFMKWRVENMITGKVEFFNPKDYYLELENCKLYNQIGAANKIFGGENKTVCAWVMADKVDTLIGENCCADEKDFVSYNPRILPHWRDFGDNNLDKRELDYLVTQGRQLYIKRKVQNNTIINQNNINQK